MSCLARQPVARRGIPALAGILATVVAALAAGPARLAAQGTGPAWSIVPQPQASLVFARNGALIGEIGRQLRTSVPLSSLPRYVPEAFIAVEDQRFYEHGGVDPIGIAGALKADILGARRGASTITQQLVGNMHPDQIDRNDLSLARKLREARAAIEMEQHYSKDQILEAYLNQIDFGHGYFGVESAARHYFGKAASRLTLPEAATLAAMPKGRIYDPVLYPARTRARRNLVLDLMARQRYITRARARAAQASPLGTAPNWGMAAPARYFVDVVRIQAERAGIPVMNGGYRIYTSLDPLLQRAATDALQDEAAVVEARRGYDHPTLAQPGDGYLQGAVVALDAPSGDVRALVGGRDYARSPYDRAVDGMRQPGSAFKPVVYATALADSLTPTTIVPDTAIAIPLPNGRVYRPEDDDHRFLGDITLREALAKSRNVVAVELGQRLGMDSVIATARRMGITSPIAPVPSSAIGASAVQPLDLVAAYTTFANLGTPVEPRFIYRVVDPAGKTVLAPPMRALPPALDPRVAFVMRDMLRDVVERGTATAVRRYLPESIPVAGKTGTTNNNTDAWFIGITPDLVAGVWMGFDRPTPIAPNAVGGTLAAPVFGQMLQRWYVAHPYRGDGWTPPVGVISADVDRATGALATPATPPAQRYTEYYVEGTEPPALRLDPWTVFARGGLVF